MSCEMHALYTNPTQRQQYLLLFLGSCAYLYTFQVCYKTGASFNVNIILCSQIHVLYSFAYQDSSCPPQPISIFSACPCLPENGIVSYFPPGYSDFLAIYYCNSTCMWHGSNLHVFQLSALSLTTPTKMTTNKK